MILQWSCCWKCSTLNSILNSCILLGLQNHSTSVWIASHNLLMQNFHPASQAERNPQSSGLVLGLWSKTGDSQFGWLKAAESVSWSLLYLLERQHLLPTSTKPPSPPCLAHPWLILCQVASLTRARSLQKDWNILQLFGHVWTCNPGIGALYTRSY